MALWNDIKKGFSDATNFTANKTTELTDSAKNKYNLYNLKNKLEKCYANIGRLYLDARKNGADHDFEITTIIMQIDKIEADIAFIKKSEEIVEEVIEEEIEEIEE